MTKPGYPVWQGWGCNSSCSAVLDLAETVPRDDPRGEANYENDEEELDTRILSDQRGEEMVACSR